MSKVGYLSKHSPQDWELKQSENYRSRDTSKCLSTPTPLKQKDKVCFFRHSRKLNVIVLLGKLHYQTIDITWSLGHLDTQAAVHALKAFGSDGHNPMQALREPPGQPGEGGEGGEGGDGEGPAPGWIHCPLQSPSQ